MREQLSTGIRVACIKNGTSIVEAAEKADIGKSVIYRYIQGKSDVGIDKMNQFCVDGLGMTMAEVVELGK